MEVLGGIESAKRPIVDPEPSEILRNMGGLKAQLIRVTRNPELASDLLHDAVVTALGKLRSGEIADPVHLEGYVYRVALNHYRNYRRKDKSSVTDSGVDQLAAGAESGSEVKGPEAEEWVQLARRLLTDVRPVRDRDLLVRYYLHEESKEELCRAFALTELHFNRVIHRARGRFRQLLHRRGFTKADFLCLAAVFAG